MSTLIACLTICPAATAQIAAAPTPIGHPGHDIAQVIAQAGCVLTEDNTNLLLFEAGIQPDDFPPMLVALIQDGIIRPTGNGTLTLVNWGPCTGGDLPAPTE
ncbi:hypothetical protein V8J82_03320 [Gymnodinialimonas sp. 2305UL16-5]|uniref:hypothetical protein n=1 Tax=Gymnodinialimonas mytili TaxID=3126503 RepID=UPI00309F7BCB